MPAALIEVVWPSMAEAPARACGDGQRQAVVYLFRWDRCGRKGQRCRVLARGRMNSALVEFDDGWRMVTSRNALRRAG